MANKLLHQQLNQVDEELIYKHCAAISSFSCVSANNLNWKLKSWEERHFKGNFFQVLKGRPPVTNFFEIGSHLRLTRLINSLLQASTFLSQTFRWLNFKWKKNFWNLEICFGVGLEQDAIFRLEPNLESFKWENFLCAFFNLKLLVVLSCGLY